MCTPFCAGSRSTKQSICAETSFSCGPRRRRIALCTPVTPARESPIAHLGRRGLQVVGEQARGVSRRHGPTLAQQPRETPVLEDASAGLAARAVVDRVLLVVDARDRRPARRGTARPRRSWIRYVLRVARARAARSSRPRASSSSIASASRSTSSGESWVESANGDRRAVWRISFDQARPMPAIARWSRSSGCSRRESAARISPSRSAPSPSASGPRCASSSSACSGREQPDAGALLRACLGEDELAAALEAEAERGRLRAFLARRGGSADGRRTSGAPSARARRRRSRTGAACRGARRRRAAGLRAPASGGSIVFSVATCAGPARSIGNARTGSSSAAAHRPRPRATRAWPKGTSAAVARRKLV